MVFISGNRPMTEEEFYNIEQAKLIKGYDLNRVALYSAAYSSISNSNTIANYIGGRNTDIIALGLSQANNIYGESTYNNNGKIGEHDGAIMDILASTSDVLLNNMLKVGNGEIAYNQIMKEAAKRASLKSGPKYAAKQIAKQAANASKTAALKNHRNVPIYSSLKLIDGIATYATTDYDKKDFQVDYKNAKNSGDFERAMNIINLNDKKSDDFGTLVVANGAAVATDYYSKGYLGDFARVAVTDLVLRGRENRFENDKKYLLKDTSYTMGRVKGTAFDTSKKGMATNVSLNEASRHLEELRIELNWSDEVFFDIATKFALGSEFNDYDKQEKRVNRLRMLIETYPAKSPIGLAQLVLDTEKEIEHKVKQSNHGINSNHTGSFLGNIFDISGFTNNEEKESEESIAKEILVQNIVKKEELQDLQTGDDLKREKKYNRDIRQQNISDSVSVETLLNEKHQINNNELSKNRTISTQEFEWMYEEIVRRLTGEIKAAQLTQ